MSEKTYWYECQERAMAPGIADGWPEVIPAPHTPNGRLVRRECASPMDELEKLREVVSRLPKTADGVPFTQGDTVWFAVDDGDSFGIASDEVDHVVAGEIVILMEWDEERISNCYSTREAAEAAAKGGE